jgi:hypothetical protein
MSWNVSLEKEAGKPVEVQRHSEGGTYVVGGTIDAELSVTYNYSVHFREGLDGGLPALHGRTGAETVDELRKAVAHIGTQRSTNYWDATPGNAGYALSILYEWARQHPDAVWCVE